MASPQLQPILDLLKSRPIRDSDISIEETRAGVDVTIEVWDEMIHVFQVFAPMLPEGQQAIDRIGEWVRQRVPAGAPSTAAAAALRTGAA